MFVFLLDAIRSHYPKQKPGDLLMLQCSNGNGMKSFVVSLIALVFWTVMIPAAEADNNGHEWITRTVKAPRVTQGFFDSRAAGTRISYHIYLPAEYTGNPQQRFPVAYWLHGSGGVLPGVAPLARYADKSIKDKKVPPFIIVFVNGLENGMYVNWKDGSTPLETIIVEELIPHIDATYRTIATRDGRLLDGYSMGGYGAARFGFKYPELFASVSMMGAGPLQAELTSGAPRKKKRAITVLQKTYGGDQSYFLQVSPRTLAAENAQRIAETVRLRMVIGSIDETYTNNLQFHEYLQGLGIPHEWIVLPGVGHNTMATLRALGDRHWAFYRAAFGHAK
jgi:enterochelin esterase-like enzyme